MIDAQYYLYNLKHNFQDNHGHILQKHIFCFQQNTIIFLGKFDQVCFCFGGKEHLGHGYLVLQ